MFHKLIRTLYYILFFATPLVMFSKTSEIFEFNKIIFIYFLSVIISGLWFITFIKKEKKQFQFSILHWVVVAFVATQIISTILSIDRHTSLFGYYGRFNGGLLSILAYAALLFVFISESTEHFIKNILKISVVSSFVVILWGLPGKFNFDLTCGVFTGTFNNSCWTNQFQPSERMFSTLGQPNWLGAYLAVTFFIGLYFYFKHVVLKENKGVANLFSLAYVVLAFITVLFTRSRSALAAVVAGIILLPLLFLYFKKTEFFIPLLKKYGVLCAILLFSVVLFKTGSESIDKHLPFHYASMPQQHDIPPPVKGSNTTPQITPPSNVTDSFDIRKIVWKGAWNLALKYPFFGTGVETFAYSYYFTRPVEHNATSEWDFLYNKAHNEFINYLATTGFVGLTAYLVMIGVVMFLFFRQMQSKLSDDYKLLSLSVFVAYITIQITNFFGFSTTTISVFFFILPAVFLYSPQSQNENKRASSMKTSFVQKFLIVCVGLCMLVGVYSVGSYWVADIQYEDAQSDIQTGHYSQGAYKLLNILKYHYEHLYEDKLSIALVGTSLTTADKKDTDKLMFMSRYYNEKALRASPYNVLYWKSRASIFYNFYQLNSDITYLEKALQALQTAEKISPTDPRLPYSAAQYASLLFDVEKKQTYLTQAEQQINTALKLKPDYMDAIEFKLKFSKKH